jgi:hypothetical protein
MIRGSSAMMPGDRRRLPGLVGDVERERPNQPKPAPDMTSPDRLRQPGRTRVRDRLNCQEIRIEQLRYEMAKRKAENKKAE